MGLLQALAGRAFCGFGCGPMNWMNTRVKYIKVGVYMTEARVWGEKTDTDKGEGPVVLRVRNIFS